MYNVLDGAVGVSNCADVIAINVIDVQGDAAAKLHLVQMPPIALELSTDEVADILEIGLRFTVEFQVVVILDVDQLELQ